MAKKRQTKYPTEGPELVKWIQSMHTWEQIQVFYNCTAWKKLKAQVLKEQHYECQRCKEKGIYSPAECVHHIKYLRNYPHLALTKSNLICLCNECHYKEHHKGEKSGNFNPETGQRWTQKERRDRGMKYRYQRKWYDASKWDDEKW